MLHRHIVALLNEAVLVVYVAAGSNERLRLPQMVQTVLAFRFESALGGVEYH